MMLIASALSAITDGLTAVIGDYGLYAVFLLMLIDAVLPAASELVMVYAGAVAAGAFAGQDVVLFGGRIESEGWAWLAMSLAGGIGYVIGSIGGWAIGYYGGRPFLERRGRWLHITPGRLDRAERWFERWGDWAVALGRVTPVVRSFIAIPAGVGRMPLGRYTLLTIPGSLAWAAAFAAVGWAFGSKWEDFHHQFRYAEYVVAAVIVAAVVAAIVRHRRGARMSGRAEDPAR
ncbi:MAG: DedA family protein [Actinobacteria bacterium]|nr:DedA family protein [Actinomycetota bacterium]